jgi:triosephosphate isomerase
MEIVIFPDAVSLAQVALLFESSSIVKIGAQDGPLEKSGTLTGSIAVANISQFCDYVILGHSERRSKLGETDEIVARKATVACDLGLIPVICVSNEEVSNADPYLGIETQLQAIPREIFSRGELLVAYEPIDAIGTGSPGNPKNVEEAARAIHKVISRLVPTINVPVLYGGSVDAENVTSYLSLKGIDGVLVGGASLAADSFLSIVDEALHIEHAQ